MSEKPAAGKMESEIVTDEVVEDGASSSDYVDLADAQEDPQWQAGSKLEYVRDDYVMRRQAQREGTPTLGAISIVSGGLMPVAIVAALLADMLRFRMLSSLLIGSLLPLSILTLVISAIGKSKLRSRAFSMLGRRIGFIGTWLFFVCFMIFDGNPRQIFEMLLASVLIIPVLMVLAAITDLAFSRE